MAFYDPKYFSRHHKRCHAEAERKLNEWPGGLPALIAQYRAGQTTLTEITEKTGVLFRGIRRVFYLHGIEPHDHLTAVRIARKLNPNWNESISRSKKAKPFYHTPETIASATAKRVATVRADPSRHGNTHTRMSIRERQFADILDGERIRYAFNKPAAHYFLDFHLPDLAVGIEVQRPEEKPDPERDAAVTAALGLRGVIYIPNWYMKSSDLTKQVVKLVSRLHLLDFSALGDCRFLCIKRGRSHLCHQGIRFMRRWSPQSSVAAQIPAQASEPTADSPSAETPRG
jgi:hypothetical protein